MTGDATIELFSARVCPYAHRTRLVLAEKGLEFELTEIDFKDKPKRFLEVINEYLEEVFPEPPLMPKDNGLRAQVRIWIDFCDDYFLDDLYGAIRNQDAAEHGELKNKVVTHLRTLEDALARLSGAGPYWLGAEACLLDFALYPFFERLPAWTHYRGLGIPDDCPHLRAWFAAMAERLSVRAIANTPEYYIERYRNYAKVVLAA
jgi:glutathione S-transferase